MGPPASLEPPVSGPAIGAVCVGVSHGRPYLRGPAGGRNARSGQPRALAHGGPDDGRGDRLLIHAFRLRPIRPVLPAGGGAVGAFYGRGGELPAAASAPETLGLAHMVWPGPGACHPPVSVVGQRAGCGGVSPGPDDAIRRR